MTIYHAPAVRYPTGFSARLAWVLTGVLMAGCGTAVVYARLTVQSAEPMLWQTGVLAASCLLAVGCVGQFLYQLKPGWLDWSGQAWHWAATDISHAVPRTPPGADALAGIAAQADQDGHVSVRFDGQSCMLVHWRSSAAAGRWLWLEQSSAPERWHDLRRAVYSRANMPVFNP